MCVKTRKNDPCGKNDPCFKRYCHIKDRRIQNNFESEYGNSLDNIFYSQYCQHYT